MIAISFTFLLLTSNYSFTTKGIIAFVFSCITGILGVCVVAWYGMSDPKTEIRPMFLDKTEGEESLTTAEPPQTTNAAAATQATTEATTEATGTTTNAATNVNK